MESTIHQTQPVILLVEDNPADQKLTQRAFDKSTVNVKIVTVANGQEAIDYLLRNGDFSDSTQYPFPDLVLMDINMPKKDGKQVLKEIKNNPLLKLLPVVMLTTSDLDRDVVDAYSYGANAYIRKPVRIADFMEVIKMLEIFWLKISLLPTKYISN